MDTSQTLFSAGISIATYILYKVAQRYYIRSGCHNKTLEISIVDKEEVELQVVTSQPQPVEPVEPEIK